MAWTTKTIKCMRKTGTWTMDMDDNDDVLDNKDETKMNSKVRVTTNGG